MALNVLKKLTTSDLSLIALCIVLIIASYIHFSKQASGKKVYVYKEDKLWTVLPLHKNSIVEIDDHNSLEIKDGKVRMLSSDCPDKRCMKMGFVETMPIICLPNRVLIEIKSDETDHKLILY